MLKTQLNTLPPTKFILIEDTFEDNGNQLFEYILRQHSKKGNKIHYCVFQGVFQKVKKRLNSNDINFYDFVTTNDDFGKLQISARDVFVIDSLALAVMKIGVKEVYRFLNDLLYRRGVLQVIAVLHLDLLENLNEVVGIFEYLCSCSVKLGSEFGSKRVSYLFKKGSGKVIRKIEELTFVDGELITKEIKKPDLDTLIKRNSEVDPTKLTTFKISLDDKEKKSRDELVLPYLPKDTKPEANISYEMDNFDDWDEEDPDDDLDI